MNENVADISVCLNRLKEVLDELVCVQLHMLGIECKDSSFQLAETVVLELKAIRMCIPSSLARLSKLQKLIWINCWLEGMYFLEEK